MNIRTLRDVALAMVRALSSVRDKSARLATAMLAGLYRRTDRRPWRLGYSEHRTEYLRGVLQDEASLSVLAKGSQLPAGYGYRLDARVIEIPWCAARLRAPSVRRILDAGSSLNYQVVVSSPPLVGKELMITTLAPERRCYWSLGVSYLFGDLRNLILRSDSMDAVCCISTIEHIGMDNERYAHEAESARRGSSREFLDAVAELKRVIRPHGVLLITFPFGRYEDHGWFQQFDADLADELIAGFAPSRIVESVFKYAPEGWRLSNRAECADCTFFDVQESKYFKAGSTVDFPPDFRAGEGAVMCLELQK